MFDSEKIKKFLNYDWKNMLDNTVPKNNTIRGSLDEEEFDTIKNGSIVMLISNIVSSLCAIFIAASFSASLFNDINLFGLKTSINISTDLFSCSIIPIVVLIFIHIYKDKEHSTWIEFIAGIVFLVNGLYSMISLIVWLASFFINPVWALLGLIATLFSIYSIILILNGIIPFSIRYNEKNTENIKKDKSDKKEKTVKESKIKYCSNCGMKITGKFCSNCGKKAK